MRDTLRLAIMVSALLASGLAGCAPADEGADDDRLAVVATTTQVGSIAAELGGEEIDLTVLLAPGVEAHDFELTPAAGAALEQADLTLVSGAGLEDWLEETIENIGAAGRVRDLSERVELRLPGDEEPGHGHDDDDEHAEDVAHGDEDEHADEVDPHYWLSAPNAIIMVENARDALSAAAPDLAATFSTRADELIERLESADADVRSMMGEVPEERRRIVTDHDALGYFIDEYGLEFVGSVFPSLDVSSEPSAQEIEALVVQIGEQGVVAIFTESSVNPRLARAVADETDARLVDEPLYTDSLGAEGSGADTLDGMLVHNARVIRGGLQGD